MEDEVLANASVDVFAEVFKLIFTKLYDEFKSQDDKMFINRLLRQRINTAIQETHQDYETEHPVCEILLKLISQWYPHPKGWGLCFIATAVFAERPPSDCRSTLGSQACPFDIDRSVDVSVVVGTTV
ncbi:hypothetical protein J5I95_07740, partial [Candidatus Poribacteria bacterium]|nr:hypothetical protein [Candidatus Poribacteria bacterium]